MGRIYVVPFTATITPGNTDLWEFLPAANLPIKIRGIRLGQISEVADAAEEGIRVTIKRLLPNVTPGTGGVTGEPRDPTRSGQTPSFAVETNNTGVAVTDDVTETLDEIGWNNRQTPYEFWFPEDAFMPGAVENEALVVRLETTLADNMTFVGNIWVEEGA